MATVTKATFKSSRSNGRRARIGGLGRGARDDVIAINRAAEAGAARARRLRRHEDWSTSGGSQDSFS
jgi:hypothetical protein